MLAVTYCHKNYLAAMAIIAVAVKKRINMKKLVIFFFVLGMTTVAFAQQDIAAKAAKTVEKLDAKLDLTPEQETAIKELYINKISSRQTRKEMAKTERKNERLAFETELTNILTAEQLDRYKQMKAARKAKRTQNVHARKGEKRAKRIANMTPEQIDQRAEKAVERMGRNLDLSETQETALTAAYRSFFLKSSEIANDVQTDATEKKSLFKDLGAQHKADVDAILTPEQLEKRAQMRQQRKNAKSKARGRR